MNKNFEANVYIYASGEPIYEETSGWKAGDIITRALSTSINGNVEKSSTQKVKQNFQGLRMAVGIGCKADKVEIIGFEHDEEERKSDESTPKTVQSEVVRNIYIHSS